MVYTEPNFQGTCQVHRDSEEFLSERRTVQSCRVSGGRSVRSHSQNSGTITQKSAWMVWDSKSSLMIILFQLFFFWLIIKCWSDHCLLSWFHFFSSCCWKNISLLSHVYFWWCYSDRCARTVAHIPEMTDSMLILAAKFQKNSNLGLRHGDQHEWSLPAWDSKSSSNH